MAEQQPSAQDEITQFIENLSNPSPGHMDASGQVDPSHMGDEVRNKMQAILLNRKLAASGRTAEALRKLLDVYPSQRDVLRQLVQRSSSLQQFEEDLFKD